MTARRRATAIVIQQAMIKSMLLITPVTDALSQSTSDNESSDIAVLCGPVRCAWRSFAVLRQFFAVFLEVLCGPLRYFVSESSGFVANGSASSSTYKTTCYGQDFNFCSAFSI